MIRLEIYSNVAGGEKGIRDYPVLPDLVDTLKAQNLEAGFVNQSFRTESEINLASGKVAQGVRVRGKAERKVQPETHIRGCLAWMRSVLARPERMLHLHIAQTRGTNGAALILGQLYARNHQVFLSGLDASGWRRMLARIDLTGKALPPEIEKDPDLLNEYVARSSRVTSFIAAVSRISDLEMLDPAWQGELTALVSSRDAGLLKKWSRARVVNLGLLNDYLERYDKLIEQFCELMASEEQQSDLPQLFELLVQQAGFPQLLKVLETFVIEEHRGKQKDPRALINAVRIGLNQSKENRRDEFRRVLARLVLSLRVSLDPPLYARGLKLPDYDNDAVDALTPVREGFLQWDQLFRAALAKAGPQSDAKVPANPVVVQALYEMGVNLIFQARISQNFSGGQQPAEVTLARDLLRILPFKPDDLNRIGAMHNKMPPRGVAQNMLKKQPLRQGDVNSIRHNLWKRLYPLGKAAFEISKYLHVQLKDQQSREETARQQAFLKGSHVLVPDSNYVLGEEGRDPLLRVATLAGGRAMGLVVLSSRDEIRNPKALDRLRAPEAAHADGYQMLMHHGGSTWFPSRVMPDHIARAYGHMVHRRVANLTRRFIANRLNHLFATHGTELFGVIYDYLAFRQGLYLSPAQAAAVLVAEKVFEPARLRESGFDPQDPGAGNRENSWLAAGENAGDGASSVAGLNLSRDWKEAGEAFMKSCQSARGAAKPSGGGKAPDGSPVSLADTLAGLAAEQIYDLHSSRAGKALESCQESASLSGLLEELLAANPDLLARPSGSADREAGREGEFTLFGELAYLALLRESHALEISAHREGGEAGTDSGAEKVQVRLLPGRFRKPGARDKASARLCGLLGQALKSHPSGRALGVAAGKLKSWDENWIRATQVASVVLTEHALRETVLRMVKPSPPRLEELRALDDR
ncbi:MAG: hypothetical protein OEZ59_11435, partial [Deltaproteobacteria bacterium]|nr:hypothetical protein [Deltaproteobacteria bacterium]